MVRVRVAFSLHHLLSAVSLNDLAGAVLQLADTIDAMVPPCVRGPGYVIGIGGGGG